MRLGLEFLKPSSLGRFNGLLPAGFAGIGLGRSEQSSVTRPNERAFCGLELHVLLIGLLKRQPRACKGRGRPTLSNCLKPLIGDIGILLASVRESFLWRLSKFGFVPVGHNKPFGGV